MSRQHKILLLCALAFAALFVAVLMLGDRQGRRDSSFARHYQAPAWLRKTGELFMARTPRIAMPRSPLTIEAGSSLEIPVGPSDDGFRGARLRLERGAGLDIAYRDTTPGALDELRHQSVRLPHDEEGDPMQTSIIAMKQGGTLTLRCRGGKICVVAAK